MVVMHDTSIATDRHVDARLTIVVVTRLGNVNDCGGLTTSDTFLLTSDTDRTASDTDLNKVCASLYEIAEAILVNHIASTNDDAVAILLTYPSDSLLLPDREAIRRVDTKYIRPSLYQCRHALLVVASIDTSTDHERFVVWVL